MDSQLSDDLEQIQKDESGLQPDVIEARIQTEEVWGMIQCYNCDYRGKMTGYIEHAVDPKKIKFVCPECNTIEVVRNPDY